MRIRTAPGQSRSARPSPLPPPPGRAPRWPGTSRYLSVLGRSGRRGRTGRVGRPERVPFEVEEDVSRVGGGQELETPAPGRIPVPARSDRKGGRTVGLGPCLHLECRPARSAVRCVPGVCQSTCSTTVARAPSVSTRRLRGPRVRPAEAGHEDQGVFSPHWAVQTPANSQNTQ